MDVRGRNRDLNYSLSLNVFIFKPFLNLVRRKATSLNYLFFIKKENQTKTILN